MTAQLETGAPVAEAGRRSRFGRAHRLWVAHRTSIAVLVPLLVLGGVAQAVNMSRFPMHIDDEGTYVAQAYATTHYGSLAQYTYWYDHPPFGWIQMALYAAATDSFGRYAHAVDAGREFMVVVQLVSVVLLWVLCRRLLLARWTSAIAVALFSFSPLALQFHRTVYLDNIATPWLIASFALALSPQKRLSAFACSGLCFAAAVLSKETSLLLLPALAVILWRGTRNSGLRRYALTLSAAAFVLGTSTYVIYAIVKGELLPGPGHVSLWQGVKFQLFTRTASGSVFQPGTLGYQHLHEWLQLDPAFPAAAVVAAVIGLFLRRIRPVAIGMVILLLIMLKPGYLPVPFVIAMLPLAAVTVAGVIDVGARWRPARWKVRAETRRRRRVPPALPAVAIGAALFLVAAVPAWSGKLRAVYESDPNAPIAQSTSWIERHVPHRDRLAVDDAYWLDLVRAGFPRDNVVWYYKMDTDPAVERLSPAGWRDYDYLVLTQSVRSDPQGIGELKTAIANSVEVAKFGTGIQQVVIRRTVPQGIAGLAAVSRTASQQRRSADTELLANHDLRIAAPVRGVLARGHLDLRAASTLALLGSTGPAQVTSFHQNQGEAAAGLPVRSLTVHGVSPERLRHSLDALPAADRDVTVRQSADSSLRLTWALSPVPPTLSY